MPTESASGKAPRVFFVNRFFHPDESATSRLLSGLAFSLASDDHHVVAIACQGSYMTSTTTHPRHERINDVQVERVRPRSLGPTKGARRLGDAIAFHLASAALLARKVQHNDIVVVKTDPPLIGTTISMVAGLRGAKVIHWMQDIFPETAAQVGVPLIDGAAGAPLRWLRNWSIRRAEAVVVIGDRMRQVVLKQGVDASRVVEISNWFDQETDAPVPATTSGLRTELAGAVDFVVGYSGNLGRAHPIEDMDGALSALCHDQNMHFVFIGSGSNRNELRQRVERKGLTNVSFHPYQDRSTLIESLQVADVHLVVLAPELEGLIVPSKFYGVLAAARPTIFVGDPAGEVATLIDAFDVGINVAHGDSAGLVAAIEYLRDHPDIALDMGTRARRLYEQQFRREHAVLRWDALLTSVAAGIDPQQGNTAR